MAEMGRGGGSDFYDRRGASRSNDSSGGGAHGGDGGGCDLDGLGTWGMGDGGGIYSGGVAGRPCLDLADLSFCS